MQKPKSEKKSYLKYSNDEIDLSDIEIIEQNRILQILINNEFVEELPLIIQIRDVTSLFDENPGIKSVAVQKSKFQNTNSSLTESSLSIEQQFSLKFDKKNNSDHHQSRMAELKRMKYMRR